MADCEQCATLRAEVSELNSMFDARWSADMRAIECWRKENPGNELVLPDHVNLCLWLMEERTRLTAEIAWHVEDKNAWQDTQAAHLREVTRLTAEVDNLKSMVIAQEKLLRSKDAENERLTALEEK